MSKNFTVLLFSVMALFSCSSQSSKNESINPEIYSDYLQKGKEISNLAQGVLLANVGKAIQQGGPEYAVEFCNLKASSIIDSLNKINDCIISRVSEKNRNPQNALQNRTDKDLWEYYSTNSAETAMDTILQQSAKLVFYQPIRITLPTCLKCHGIVGEDIIEVTHKKIKNLYPDDLATGYQLNDFRGMWKIIFETN